MANAADINAEWIAAAQKLQDTEPVQYALCALAIISGKVDGRRWKIMIGRLGIPDGTARGVRILEDRILTEAIRVSRANLASIRPVY